MILTDGVSKRASFPGVPVSVNTRCCLSVDIMRDKVLFTLPFISLTDVYQVPECTKNCSGSNRTTIIIVPYAFLEKETATHSSIHTWKIPWTEEPGGLQSMGSQRVGHD